MRKALVILVLLVSTLGGSSVVGAQELEGGHGIGIGAVQNFGGLGFTSAVFDYDLGKFRIEGLFAFQNDGTNTSFGIGGRFWYVVHHLDRADLGLGGGLTLVHNDAGSTDNVLIEGGVQIRAFVTSNVALTATAGLLIVAGDGPTIIDIGGQPFGAFGISYYFK